MNENEMKCLSAAFIIVCGLIFYVVSPLDYSVMNDYFNTLESPNEITIVCGINTLFTERTTLQNVTYYKYSGNGGFDIKYKNETGEPLEMNINRYHSFDAKNGKLTIYL